MTTREHIHKLHQKYYKKDPKPDKETEPVIKDKDELKDQSCAVISQDKSRNDLMFEAKAKGIKNFRILNKAELTEILAEGTSQDRINEIVSAAKIRWQSGWKKNKAEQK